MDKQITQYLKKYHRGEARAVSSRELETAFGIRGAELRKLVNRLRRAGIPVCSFAQGYYYAETEKNSPIPFGSCLAEAGKLRQRQAA